MSAFQVTAGSVRCGDCGMMERAPRCHDCGFGIRGLTLEQVEAAGVSVAFACGHPVSLAVPDKCGTCRASMMTLRGELSS